MSTLGERIRGIRKKLRLSQQEFADRLGLKSRQSIFEYESDSNEPNIQSLKLISKMAEKSIDWLIYGDDIPNHAEAKHKVSMVRENENPYHVPSLELQEDEIKIILLLRSKPALIPVFIELLENKIKQDELIKKFGEI